MHPIFSQAMRAINAPIPTDPPQEAVAVTDFALAELAERAVRHATLTLIVQLRDRTGDGIHASTADPIVRRVLASYFDTLQGRR